MTADLPDRAADREREWCPECAGHRTVRVISATHAISVACPACTGGPLAAAALAARRLATAPDGGTYAFHCRDATCSAAYRWTLTREGDVVTTWACDRHLAAALAELIGDRGPDTRVTVTAALAARPAPDNDRRQG